MSLSYRNEKPISKSQKIAINAGFPAQDEKNRQGQEATTGKDLHPDPGPAWLPNTWISLLFEILLIFKI